jgi:streptogrisin C
VDPGAWPTRPASLVFEDEGGLMKRTNLFKVAVAGLAAGAAVLSLAPAAAATPLAGRPMLTAMQRDLHLTPQQAQTRLHREATATARAPAARAAAGAAFGGSWYNTATGALVVGVTDAASAPTVRATGADVVRVSHTQATLDTAKGVIDTYAGQAAPKDVTGWYVDERANSVVVTVEPGANGQDVRKFLDFASTAGPVRVVPASTAPRLYDGDVVGGDPYYTDGLGRCSIGFSVRGGFISAGHCGKAGDAVTGPGGSPMGTFRSASFPGTDYSYVRTDPGWTPSSTVDGYGYADVRVSGSATAAVGSSVCRSGSTSGWRCGTVVSTNQTVNYPQGTVSGLTRTDVCAEPGDSGGPWLNGSRAEGVTSGGVGDCTSGGITFFQPVNPILSAYGLTLVTG